MQSDESYTLIFYSYNVRYLYLTFYDDQLRVTLLIINTILIAKNDILHISWNYDRNAIFLLHRKIITIIMSTIRLS